MIVNTRQKDSARYEGPGISLASPGLIGDYGFCRKLIKKLQASPAEPPDEVSTCLAACFVLNLGASPQRLLKECALTKQGGLASALQRKAHY